MTRDLTDLSSRVQRCANTEREGLTCLSGKAEVPKLEMIAVIVSRIEDVRRLDIAWYFVTVAATKCIWETTSTLRIHKQSNKRD